MAGNLSVAREKLAERILAEFKDNINSRLTGEQRKVLERVFDLIMQEYDRESAESFVNTISSKF